MQAMEKKKEEEKARRRAEKQPGFDGRWYTDVNAHTKFVHFFLGNTALDYWTLLSVLMMMMRLDTLQSHV